MHSSLAKIYSRLGHLQRYPHLATQQELDLLADALLMEALPQRGRKPSTGRPYLTTSQMDALIQREPSTSEINRIAPVVSRKAFRRLSTQSV